MLEHDLHVRVGRVGVQKCPISKINLLLNIRLLI